MTSDRPIIGFLTDFGLDGAAAICRAVILSICRDAQVVDICHTVPKFSVRQGAHLLRGALPWFPVGVHLAVVDPGVGTDRRPIALRTARGDVLVGPDNGLLIPAADALGGDVEIRELRNPDYRLPATSSTFHGRDVFAPAAGHLAVDPAAFERLGPTVDSQTLVRLEGGVARLSAGRIETEVSYVDSFGNLRLAVAGSSLEKTLGGSAGAAVRVTLGASFAGTAVVASTFGDVPVGALLVYVDSSGDLALAESQGDLARRYGADVGTRILIEAT